MKKAVVKDLIRASKKTPKYESRAAIQQKNHVSQIVNRVAAGLSGFSNGDEQEIVNAARATQKIVDEYYQPEEIPSMDAITEMMGWDNPRCKYAVVGAVALLVGLFLYCR